MEPTSIISGTSLHWSRADVYAQGLWQYEYVFTGPQQFTLSAEADLGFVDVAIAVADSSNWTSGKYQWTLQRKKELEVVFIDTGYITVIDNPAEQVTVDHRSHAEKMLALIETRLEGRIVSDHESYSHNGRSLNRIPLEQLNKLAKQYRNTVAKEKRRDAGKKSPRYARFGMR
mgnify:CR=1 FL=1|jgi:hypothetical protein